MVFIHGGSFLSGSGSMYDGSGLAAHDVVVVTINYRLGPFGFFAHPLLTAESPHASSGNYGLLDQRAALEWVRRNIAEFGGDPAAVTVFGESAGGASIVDHLVSPGSDGLFAQAIVQSAPYIDDGIVIYSTRPLAVAERLGAGLSRKLGCAGAPDELAALRDVPADRLLEVGDPGDDIFPTGITYQPVVDGWVLPDVPADLLAEGRFSHVPLVVGSTRDEADIAAVGVGPADLDAAEAERALRRIYGDQFDAIIGLFSSSAGQSGGGEAGGGGDSTGAEVDTDDTEDEALSAAVESVTLTLFTAPARYAADRMAATDTPTYRYLFTAAPLGESLGAFHGSELPYVFGSDMLDLDLAGHRSAELSAAMMRYWTRFAAAGDPNGGGLPDWPLWSPDAQLTQELGWTIRTIERYQDHECDVAERLFAPEP
jgi:para-nitrobenzyl esterase